MSQVGVFFPHRFSFQINGVSVMDEAVEDGIGEGGVADEFMPLLDRQLRGDDGGTESMAVIEDVEQVTALLGIERVLRSARSPCV